MAFGEWMKKISNGLKNFGEKVKGVVNKVGNFVHKGVDLVNRVAPAVGAIGTAIGGPAGEVISNISNTAQDVAGRVGGFVDNVQRFTGGDSTKFLSPKY